MSATGDKRVDNENTGVLLINLGTPSSPSTRDVRRYLREFLGDPDVIDLPPLQRWLLLNLIILPFRPRRSAAAYQQIWTEEGSPLAVYGAALTRGIGEQLGREFHVSLGMRYGSPSIASALCELRDAGVSRIIAVPLFPHYSTATVGSVEGELRRCVDAHDIAPPVDWVSAFYDAPGFIHSVVEIARRELAAFSPDHIVFSYHGLPEHQVRGADTTGELCLVRADCCDSIGDRNSNCYRAQCYATTRAASAALALTQADHSVAFQSRLGRTPWIQPYLDDHLEKLADAGVKRLAIICPSFVADCLETLEEIGIRGRERWEELSGGELLLVPCVNASPKWTESLAELIRATALAE